MKQISGKIGLLLAVMFLFSGQALADSVKIGWVDQLDLMQSAPQVEAARKRLEAEFSSRQREVLAMDEDLRNMREKYNREQALMKEEQQRQMERDILARDRDVKRSERELKEDITMRQNEVFVELRKEILALIAEFAKNNGYDLILSEGAAYAGPKIDVTSQILDLLRARTTTGRSPVRK